MIQNAPKHLVLGLYKQLIRESRNLKYTDQTFFHNRIRQEFIKRKNAKDNNLYYIVCNYLLYLFISLFLNNDESREVNGCWKTVWVD